MRYLFTLLLITVQFFNSFAQNKDSLEVQIEKYSSVLEKDSLNTSIRYLRANTYQKLEKDYLAFDDYELIIQIDSTYKFAFYNSDNELVLLDEPNIKITDSSKAIILKQKHTYYLSNLAYEALENGESILAIELCNKALLLDSLDYDAKEYRGYANFFLGNYEKSIPDFIEVLEYGSTNYYSNYNLASALSNAGKHEEAIPYYRYVLDVRPNFKEINFNVANTYFNIMEYDSAMKYIDSAIIDSPNNPEYINVKGNIYINQSQYTSALEHYKQALTIDSTDAKYWGNIGLAYYHLDEYSKAEEYLNTAIELNNSDYYEFYDTRARVYYKLNNYEKSNDDYFTSIKLNSPQFVHGSIGWNFYCLKQYNNCIKHSEIAVSNNPEAWYAFYNIALSNLCLTNYDESFELYKELKSKASETSIRYAKIDLKVLKKKSNMPNKKTRKRARKTLRKCF